MTILITRSMYKPEEQLKKTEGFRRRRESRVPQCRSESQLIGLSLKGEKAQVSNEREQVFNRESSEGTVAILKMLEKGPNPPKIAQKRIRFKETMEKGEEDRISTLPDCLLLEILSRLPSTKQAIRTGTLSKRWEHLWTLVPSLIFAPSYRPESRDPISDFATSVDKTLTQCRQLKLKKFKVFATHDIRFESQFKNWIHHAIRCNVEELNLEFQYPHRYQEWKADFQLDQSNFFINSCFTNLTLKGCMLNPNGEISWKKLRSLCISYLHLDEDLLINIVSGSPLLETLVLEYDSGYGRPTFDAYYESKINDFNSLSLTQCPQLKKLKKFKVHSVYDSRLESRLNSWICYAIRCNVEKICLHVEPEFNLDQMLFTGSCFTELTLDGCIVNPLGAISWKNLRSLHVSNGCLDEVMIGNILSGSPVLETLELEYCFNYKRLDITSKSVKNFVLSGYSCCHGKREVGIIEINAPYILSLTIQHQFFSMNKLLLVNVSSLVKAKLDYRACTMDWWCSGKTTPKDTEPEWLKEVILKLGHVKEVNIGLSCCEVLSCLQAQGFIVPSNVKFPQVTGLLML